MGVKSLNGAVLFRRYGSTHSNSKHHEAAAHQDVGMMEAASLWLAFLICVIMLCVRRWSPQQMLWLWPCTYNFSMCFSRMVHHGSISYMMLHACMHQSAFLRKTHRMQLKRIKFWAMRHVSCILQLLASCTLPVSSPLHGRMFPRCRCRTDRFPQL